MGKAAFAMEKGSVVDLPQTSLIKSLEAGLGWDTDQGEIDLDVSAVLLDARANVVDACFFNNRNVMGIEHSGDNRTGAGTGDDETIKFDLKAIPQKVQQIVIAVNIYTLGMSFANVSNPYCRLVIDGNEEICRYMLSQAGRDTGLVISRLFREPGNT